jgi:KDO2-lipid IV(A) lauroyltransferase
VLTRLGIGALWCLRFLPLGVLSWVGGALGWVTFHLWSERRHICLINLQKCFPNLSEGERRALARRHFVALGRSVVERGILWWSSGERVARLIRLVGTEHWERAPKPVIFLVPHFVGLDAGATRLGLETEAVSIYSRQKNPLVNELLLRYRSRFRPVKLFSRQDGLLGVVRALRKGIPFYYLPDQDYGPRDSVFVPFFGVPTATITGVSRIAHMTHATILPFVVRMLPGGQGYEAQFYPAWTDFPTEDVAVDARRVNAFMEDRVREMPEQYHWLHKRFKTRPPGEAAFY